jgi:hypothetical protein
MDTNTFALLGLVLIGAGIAGLALGGIMARREQRRSAAWKRAAGEIVDVVTRQTTPGNIHYYAVVEFETNKGSRRFESSTGQWPRRPASGTAVTVLYDPADPDQVRIDDFTQRWFASLAVAGLGCIALALGLMFRALSG